MFDYTKETVINSNMTADGLKKFFAEGDELRILRVMNYKKEFLYGKVYKTDYQPGVNAECEITAKEVTTATAGQYQISLDIRMLGKFLSDYANAIYNYQKPVIVDIELSAGMTAEQVAERVSKALSLATPENNRFITVKLDGEKVIVSGTDSNQIFDSIKVFKYVTNKYTPSFGEYVENNEVLTVEKTKENIPAFGTAAYITENLRIPTYPNVRWNSTNDEMPVTGGVYNEYAFQYRVPKKGLSGLQAVGEELVSVTNHVFFVLASLAEEFEAAITEAFGDVIVESNSIEIISASSIVADGNGVSLKANLYPPKEGVTVTWEIVDNPSPSKITLEGNLLTVQPSIDNSITSITVKATAPGFKETLQTINIESGN